MVRDSWWRLGRAVTTLMVAGGLLAGCVIGPPGADCDPDGSDPVGWSDATGRPTRVAIDHDAFEAKQVGHLPDGRQFFLTTPFEPGENLYVAQYLFDARGQFLSAEIDKFGIDDTAAAKAGLRRRAHSLGQVRHDRIEVEPFAIHQDGQTFGLIPAHDQTWWVTAEPGDYMAWSSPFSCGRYDT